MLEACHRLALSEGQKENKPRKNLTVVSMRKIVIKKTVTNILLLYIIFAIFFGIVLYPISKCLMLVGLDSLYSIVLGGCISMMVMMTALKLTG